MTTPAENSTIKTKENVSEKDPFENRRMSEQLKRVRE
jgi:hypothetical protein